MKISDHARGHWPQIIGTLLGEQYTNKRKNGPCPSTGECGKGTPRYRFSDKYGSGNFFCHCSDGKGDGLDLLQCVRGYDFASACRDVESVIGACPRDTEVVEVKKTLAELMRAKVSKTGRSSYLEGRGLEVAPGLDWVKSMPYFEDSDKAAVHFPAMLAPVMRDGKFLTYHVTYLHGGKKAEVPTPRKILPGPSNAGGACPLYAPAEHMGIAEGVETAIAAKMIFGVPVWAALNTALLASWEPPAIAKRIIICADNDSNYAGHAAAYQLAHRLKKKGLEVEVQICPEQDKDWNDILLTRPSLAA
jgi:putative DNA primase/helicase